MVNLSHRLAVAVAIVAGSAVAGWVLRDELSLAVAIWVLVLMGAALALLLRPADKLDRAALRALREANVRALESARVKAEFLATMSHEIRTPLNGVVASAQLLAGTNLSEEQQDHVDIIQTSSEALLAIIDDILDLSKIEAGRMELERAPFELVRVFDDVLDILAERIRSKGLEVAYDIDPTLPRRLIGDATRLRQVLLNLLSNAVKFTERGEVTLTAQCVERDAGELLLEIVVADTGIGISADHLARLFAPFVQADSSTTRRFGGTGLGLAICKRLVTFMGGEIGVQSEIGHGSRFAFTARLGVDTTYVPTRPVPDLRDHRVLLVHPNDAMRSILTGWCRRWGMQIDPCSTTGAAIRQLAAGAQYEVVVFAAGAHDTASDTFVLQWAEDTLVIVLADRHRRVVGAGSEAIAAELIKPIKPAALEGAIASALGLALPVAEPLRVAHPSERTNAEDAPPPRVLIVEDLEINQHLARKLLERLGCAVDTAADGRSALDCTAGTSYDLIFMDVQMPDMDGMAVTRAIRAQPGPCRHTPIVAMTANALHQHRLDCLAAGMNDYMTKPLASDLLRSMIRRYVFEPATAQRASIIASAEPSANAVPDGVPPILDPQRVQVLADLAKLRVDAFGPVIALYSRTVTAQLVALREAIAAGDAAKLGAAAHAIKGSALNVGANRVAVIARRIEHEAGRQDAQAFTADCDRIAQAFDESVAALRACAEKVDLAQRAGALDHP